MMLSAHRALRTWTGYLVGFVLVICLCACSKGGVQPDTRFTGEAGKFPAVTHLQVGSDPEIAAGQGSAPASLAVKVLSLGTGPKVTEDSQIVVNYRGQLWDGTQIRDTFQAGAERPVLRLAELMPGWRRGLTGIPAGSRVLLVIPPSEGYQHGEREKVPAGSTQVYVIDVISTMDLKDTSALRARQNRTIAQNLSKLPTWVKITGEMGNRPEIVLAEGAPTVKKSQLLMIVQGRGEKIQADDFPAVHVTSRSFTQNGWGKTSSTWDKGVMESTPTPVNNTPHFLGVPVGSRMVWLQPAQAASQQTTAHPARIVVYDIAAKQSAR